MKKPNLFDYATSELSQDAFIAWLLEWSNPGYKDLDPALHECSLEMIRTCFQLHNKACPNVINTAELSRQTGHIDVLCVLDSEYAIIIEDKKGTTQHGDQLPRYLQEILGRNFARGKIVPIYFQTHEQSDYGEAESAGYKLLSRDNLLAILRRHASPNHIFLDFRDKLEELHDRFGTYLTAPIQEWDWYSWQGFYQRLQREFRLVGEVWRYVANPSGGFLGFFWCWNHDPEHKCDVYLQLEQTKFCFKIAVGPPDTKAAARAKWLSLLQEHGKKFNLQVQKPTRFGSGNYITVAVLGTEYRVVGEKNLLDLPGTVAQLHNIEAMLSSACSANKANVAEAANTPAPTTPSPIGAPTPTLSAQP